MLFAEIKNRPGAVATTVEKLARARINVESAYATAHPWNERSRGVSLQLRHCSSFGLIWLRLDEERQYKGGRNPALVNIGRLASALRVSLTELFSVFPKVSPGRR